MPEEQVNSNVFTAVRDALMGRFASEEERGKRRAVCNVCEFKGVKFDESMVAFDYCKSCNCPLKTRVSLTNHHCPNGFW